eukprot:27858-Amphidinium_carterae.1
MSRLESTGSIQRFRSDADCEDCAQRLFPEEAHVCLADSRRGGVPYFGSKCHCNGASSRPVSTARVRGDRRLPFASSLGVACMASWGVFLCCAPLLQHQ